MFERPHHRRIASVLEALDGERLRGLQCWFGGGTAVWTTVMLFFQAALFAGYLYAHLLAQRAPRTQAAVHVALFAAAVALAAVVALSARP